MGFVAVDIGASNTRYVADNGKVSILANNMVFESMDKEIDVETYNGNLDANLEVIIEKEGKSEYFPTKVLIGQIAESYSSNNERPSGLTNKHTQKINYISGVVAAAISKLKNGGSDAINLFVALPPIECRTAKEEVERRFKGRYTVTFPRYKEGTKINFEIVSVQCFEESFLALLSYFFDAKGQVKQTSEKYMFGNVLSLDIGATTTDLAIVKNGRYLNKSGQTYRNGVNIARDYLVDSVRARYGFDLPLDDAVLTMCEGRLQLGNKYEDISELVDDAKIHLAKSIVNQMQGYFRQIDIPIQTIRAIVVSGGGSLQSQYINDKNEVVVTSKPLSFHITQFIKDICSGVEVEEHGENPRMANINGLFIRAKVEADKKESKQ